MKALLAILLSLTLTILSFPQEEGNDIQFGFGVSLSSELSMYNVYGGYEESQIETLPINMANFSMIIKGSFFRFEPSLGYFTMSSDYSGGGYTFERSSSNIRLGAVLAFNNDPIESVNFYYGVDFGFILSSKSRTSNISNESTDESKTDFFIGPAVGGEYMFNNLIAFRAGYKSLFLDNSEEGLTAGVGLNYNFTSDFGVRVDYAYQDFGMLDYTQHFSLGIRF